MSTYLDEVERELRGIGAQRPIKPDVDPEPRPGPGRFDGAAAWARLGREAHDAIGSAALELIVARYGADLSPDMQTEVLFEAAEDVAGGHLEEIALEHLLHVGAIPRADVPGIPSLLGRICAECGATSADAGWRPPWTDWTEDGVICPCCMTATGAQEASPGR